MKKKHISNLLRQLRLIYLTDWVQFFIQKFKNKKINNEFKRNNPDVKLPPDYLIYESFQLNYYEYYTSSLESAKMYVEHFSKYLSLKDKKILDWGCGPGRIIRHLPNIIGNGCEYFGTDYNTNSIDWCSKNLTGMQFNKNSLKAHLPYSDNFFDIIYGISILTHLSEQLHYDWHKELYRILKPNGIMLLTTQGDNFKFKLMDSELNKYNNGELIVRDKVKEGHRTYSVFHPISFMVKLFKNVQVLEHIQNKVIKEKRILQDIWVTKKISLPNN